MKFGTAVHPSRLSPTELAACKHRANPRRHARSGGARRPGLEQPGPWGRGGRPRPSALSSRCCGATLPFGAGLGSPYWLFKVRRLAELQRPRAGVGRRRQQDPTELLALWMSNCDMFEVSVSTTTTCGVCNTAGQHGRRQANHAARRPPGRRARRRRARVTGRDGR